MNPATACATVVIDELVRHGVRDAVLCPGSRSAPLAFALHAADAEGRLRLHVRTDERAAAFLALGLAKGSGRPVPVVTTSGTAVANLHPAVLEASHAGVPLVMLTADRPPELRGTGANQTTSQVGIFGGAARWQQDLGTPDGRPGQVATWRSAVSRAVHAAVGTRGGAPGPVHLNVPLREPLVPEDDSADVLDDSTSRVTVTGPAGDLVGERLDGRDDGGPWTSVPAAVWTAGRGLTTAEADGISGRAGELAGTDQRYENPMGLTWQPWDGPVRTVVLVGDLPAPGGPEGVDWGAAAADLAASRGWPLIAEPSGAGARPRALPCGSLLLTTSWVRGNLPQRVVVVGRITLSRATARLLRDPGIVIDLVSDDPVWPDPAHQVRHVLPLRALLTGTGGQVVPDSAAQARAVDAPATAARTVPGGTLATDDSPLADELAARSAPAAREGAVAQAAGAVAQAAVDRAAAGDAGAWADRWRHAAGLLAEPVHELVDQSWPSGLAVAVTLDERLPDDAMLFVGSSNPVRDFDLVGPTGRAVDVTVVANRGLAGIDGCVSTAVGLALTVRRPAYALVGDLTFAHDAAALMIGPDEPRPDLTVVVINDDGGGIFTLLEPGEARHAGAFERIFGTPLGLDLRSLCAATGTAYQRADSPQELAEAIARKPSGMRVVEVRVDRSACRDLHYRLRAVAEAAVGD